MADVTGRNLPPAGFFSQYPETRETGQQIGLALGANRPGLWDIIRQLTQTLMRPGGQPMAAGIRNLIMAQGQPDPLTALMPQPTPQLSPETIAATVPQLAPETLAMPSPTVTTEGQFAQPWGEDIPATALREVLRIVTGQEGAPTPLKTPTVSPTKQALNQIWPILEKEPSTIPGEPPTITEETIGRALGVPPAPTVGAPITAAPYLQMPEPVDYAAQAAEIIKGAYPEWEEVTAPEEKQTLGEYLKRALEGTALAWAGYDPAKHWEQRRQEIREEKIAKRQYMVNKAMKVSDLKLRMLDVQKNQDIERRSSVAKAIEMAWTGNPALRGDPRMLSTYATAMGLPSDQAKLLLEKMAETGEPLYTSPAALKLQEQMAAYQAKMLGAQMLGMDERSASMLALGATFKDIYDMEMEYSRRILGAKTPEEKAKWQQQLRDFQTNTERDKLLARADMYASLDALIGRGKITVNDARAIFDGKWPEAEAGKNLENQKKLLEAEAIDAIRKGPEAEAELRYDPYAVLRLERPQTWEFLAIVDFTGDKDRASTTLTAARTAEVNWFAERNDIWAKGKKDIVPPIPAELQTYWDSLKHTLHRLYDKKVTEVTKLTGPLALWEEVALMKYLRTNPQASIRALATALIAGRAMIAPKQEKGSTTTIQEES